MGNTSSSADTNALECFYSHVYGKQIHGGKSDDDEKKKFLSLESYGDSIYSEAKEKLIRDIAGDVASILKVSKEFTNTADINKIVQHLQKIVPNPRGKKNIKNNAVFHKELCNKLADSINSRYGIELINKSAAPEAVCNKVAEVLYSLFNGLHSEFLTISGDVTRTIKNLQILQDFVDSANKKLIQEVEKRADSEDVEARSIGELYDKLSQEISRQQAILSNLVDSTIGPVGDSLIELLEDNENFGPLTQDLKNLVGTANFGTKLGYVLNGTSAIIYTAKLVDDALKKVGMSVAEYKSADGDLKKLYEKIYDSIARKKPSNEELYKMLAAANIIISNDTSHDDIIAFLEKKKGGFLEKKRGGALDDTYGESFLNAADISDAMKEYTSPLSGRTQSTRKSIAKQIDTHIKLRRQLFITLNAKIKNTYEKIKQSLGYLGRKIGTEVPISDQLALFIQNLVKFADIQIEQKNLIGALSGYRQSIESSITRHRFMSSLNDLSECIAPLINKEGGSTFKELKQNIDLLSHIITEFTNTFAESLSAVHIEHIGPKKRDGGMGFPDVSGIAEIGGLGFPDVSGIAEIGGDEGLDDVLLNGGVDEAGEANMMDEDVVLGVSSDDVDDEDIVVEGGAIESTNLARHIAEIIKSLPDSSFSHYKTMLKSIREINYYYKIAGIKKSIKRTSKEFVYNTDNYVNILGEEAGYQIDQIQKRYNALIKALGTDKEAINAATDNNLYSSLPSSIMDMGRAANAYTTFKRPLGEQLKKIKTDNPNDKANIDSYESGYKFLLEYIRSAKVEMIEAAQSLDLYLSKFTQSIQSDPDQIKEFLQILEQIEVVAKWFTDKSGDKLAGVFEAFPRSDEIDTNNRVFNINNFKPDSNVNANYNNKLEEDYKIPDYHYYDTFRDPNYRNGIFYNPRLMTREQAVNFVKQIEQSIKGVRALENVIATFSRVNTSVSAEVRTFMSSGLMFKAFMKYMVASSISIGYNIVGNDNRILYHNHNNVYDRVFHKMAVALHFNKPNRKISVNETLVLCDPLSDPENLIELNPELEQKKDFFEEVFEMSIKSLIAKIFTVVGSYSLFNKPAKYQVDSPSFVTNPIRQILGGNARQSIKIYPEITELYIRLPLLAEWYRTIFEFNATKGSDEINGIYGTSPPPPPRDVDNQAEQANIDRQEFHEVQAHRFEPDIRDAPVEEFLQRNEAERAERAELARQARQAEQAVKDEQAEPRRVTFGDDVHILNMPLLVPDDKVGVATDIVQTNGSGRGGRRGGIPHRDGDPIPGVVPPPRLAIELNNGDIDYYRQANPLISIIPDMDSIWGDLCRVIFFDGINITDGSYPSEYANRIINAINKIFHYYKSKDSKVSCRYIIDEFVIEINRRYGLIMREEINDYLDEKYSYKTEDAEYPEYDILDVEAQIGRTSAPSDKFRTFGKAKTPRKSTIQDLLKAANRFRTAIDNNLRIYNADNQIDNAWYNKMADTSLSGLIREVKKDAEHCTTDEECYKVIHNQLHGMNRYGDIDKSKLIMFHETIITPLTVLYYTYAALNKFNKFFVSFTGYDTDATEETLIRSIDKHFKGVGNPYKQTVNQAANPYTMNQQELSDYIVPDEVVEFVHMREFIEREDLVRMSKNNLLNKLIEQLQLVGCDMNGLTEISFGGNNYFPIFIYDKLEAMCTELIVNIKSALKHLRKFIPNTLLKEYEDSSRNVSIFFIEEHLIKRLFNNKYGNGLVDANVGLKKLWEGLMKAKEGEGEAERKISYNNAMRTAIFWNKNIGDIRPRPTNFISNARLFPYGYAEIFNSGASINSTIKKEEQLVANKLVGRLEMDDNESALLNLNILKTPGGIGDAARNYFLGSQYLYNVDDSIFNNNIHPNLGLVCKLNSLIYKYCNMFIDKGNKKIYKTLVENFINGHNAKDIIGGKNINDSLYSANLANSVVLDSEPQKNAVLFASLASGLKSLIMARATNLVGTASMFVEDNLLDVSEYQKELMRAYLPAFEKEFNILVKRAEFIRTALENAKVNVTYTAAADENIISNNRQAIINSNAGIEPKYTQRNVLASADMGDEQRRGDFINIVNDVIMSAKSIIKCINTVQKELMDVPLYFETYKESIIDYNNVNNTLPFMPISDVTYLMNANSSTQGIEDLMENDNTINLGIIPTSDIIFGTPEFKFTYGTRGLLYYKQEPSIEYAPGVIDMLKKYNSRMGDSAKFDGKLIADLTKNIILLSRWTIDNMYHNQVVGNHDWNVIKKYTTETVPGVRNLTCQTARNGEIPKYETWKSISLITLSVEVDSYKQALERLLSCICTDANNITTISKISRSNYRVYNILDLNIVPINIHAMQREIPFVNLSNYAYTFDQIIKNFIGFNTKNMAITNIGTYDNLEDPRDIIVMYTIYPLGDRTRVDYYDGVNKIVNGTPELGLGRPKYLSDQLWNKVLLGKIYNNQNINVLTYVNSEQQLVSIPNLNPNALELEGKGFLRYNSKLIRWIEWSVHIQRIIRMIMRQQLDWVSDPVVQGNEAISKEVTEYKDDEIFSVDIYN
jgi:hypothetical protein